MAESKLCYLEHFTFIQMYLILVAQSVVPFRFQYPIMLKSTGGGWARNTTHNGAPLTQAHTTSSIPELVYQLLLLLASLPIDLHFSFPFVIFISVFVVYNWNPDG